MKPGDRTWARTLAVLILTTVWGPMAQAQAQAQAPVAPIQGQTALPAVSVREVLAALAQKARKPVTADARVDGQVFLAGESLGSLSYDSLYNLLTLAGFATVELDGVLRVVPDAAARQQATAIVTGRENLPGSQMVTRLIEVRSASAVQLVPILRPLVPQQGHLAAVVCKNTLLLVDSFANVKRIEAIVRSIDQGEAFETPPCDEMSPGPVVAPQPR